LIAQFGGVAGNVLKFKPPLTTPADDFERMLDITADVVAFIQRQVERKRAEESSHSLTEATR
jgi:hypothetical protein